MWVTCRWDQGAAGKKTRSKAEGITFHGLESKRMSQDQREGDSEGSTGSLTSTVLSLMGEQLQLHGRVQRETAKCDFPPNGWHSVSTRASRLVCHLWPQRWSWNLSEGIGGSGDNEGTLTGLRTESRKLSLGIRSGTTTINRQQLCPPEASVAGHDAFLGYHGHAAVSSIRIFRRCQHGEPSGTRRQPR